MSHTEIQISYWISMDELLMKDLAFYARVRIWVASQYRSSDNNPSFLFHKQNFKMAIMIQYESAYAKSIFNSIRSCPSRQTHSTPQGAIVFHTRSKVMALFQPKTFGQKLNIMSAWLIMEINLKGITQVNVLKLSLSLSLSQLTVSIMVPMLYFASIWMVKFGRMLTSWI